MKRAGTLLDFDFRGGSVKKKAQQVEAEEDQSTLSAQSEKQPDVAQAGVREHKFQNEWLKKWPWLSKTETGMQCTLCLKHNKKNAWLCMCVCVWLLIDLQCFICFSVISFCIVKAGR